MTSVVKTEDCIIESKRLKTGDCTRVQSLSLNGHGNIWTKPENVWYQPESLWTNILVKKFGPEKFGGSNERCKMTEVCLIENVKSEAYLAES
eukprot:9900201-Karenia_brevis.AAC.1